MIRTLLVANRGEVALRVIRTAAEMGVRTVAVAPADDAASLHLARADHAVRLPGAGPSAYLDVDRLVQVARANGCEAVHPGYGFLSESAAFARACLAAGLIFVGPEPDQLDRLGDKAAARALAVECGAPVLAGTQGAVSLAEAQAFMADLGRPVMLKAVAGGGGRGIRRVSEPSELEAAFDRCRSEAERAFGDGRLYVEQALDRARHIEVQVVGDGSGEAMALGERDCTVQRRHQKLIEVTPSPFLTSAGRQRLIEAALGMARAVRLRNLATFEFLVDADDEAGVYFMEANPRLQVEHTVTEEHWGVDLVEVQLRVASGEPLTALGLDRLTPRRGYSLQARVNMERMLADGTLAPEGGVIAAFEPCGGPGVRVDGFGYAGYAANAAYDSLLAKVIVSASAAAFPVVAAKTERALAEFRVDGVTTNLAFLRALLQRPELADARLTTRFVDERLSELLQTAETLAVGVERPGSQAPAGSVLPEANELQDGAEAVLSHLSGVVVGVMVEAGHAVAAGQTVAVVEAMKMEHLVTAPMSGVVIELRAHPGQAVATGQRLAVLRPAESAEVQAANTVATDPAHVRPDLAEVVARHQAVLDAGRPDAVARRRAKGARTARENVAAVCDAGGFVEYGALVVAGQRRRRSIEELIAKTPGDGLMAGFGPVNGAAFGPDVAQCLLLAFDETVLAGTMGELARAKLRHVLAVADKARTPVILFAEGGGGRAGDTDALVGVTGWTMDVSCYYLLGRMSGLVPLIGVASGRCFAANAGMLASCDVIIATKDANIGVGGPSMVEGGRLGRFTPEEIGPMSVQVGNGVVDILVEDEAEAAAVARRYLAYFQGPAATWEAADQRALRHVVPESRVRGYEVRNAIELMADTGSVLELRAGFGVGIVTALVRVEGRALGVIANNPLHLGGAIDSDAADKASRFMRLCEAFGLPVLFLCDTPGMMVGPDAERQATVRKMGRMFVTGANLTVPFFTVVLRKAYGIGAELMAGGWFKAPRFVVSWPSGEFGGMNIEGNVTLAHTAELQAQPDAEARRALFDAKVAEMYETGRALSVATHYEIDAVIDPADTRAWIVSAIGKHRPRRPGSDKTVPFVDLW